MRRGGWVVVKGEEKEAGERSLWVDGLGLPRELNQAPVHSPAWKLLPGCLQRGRALGGLPRLWANEASLSRETWLWDGFLASQRAGSPGALGLAGSQGRHPNTRVRPAGGGCGQQAELEGCSHLLVP